LLQEENSEGKKAKYDRYKRKKDKKTRLRKSNGKEQRREEE
jgi:hypothetical protein